MIRGFVKTAAAVPRVIPGDVDFNVTEIIDQMAEASDEGVQVLVFPELSVTGASCQDLFLQQRLQEAAYYGLQDIIDASAGMDMLIFVGLPWKKDGKLYNVTAAVKDGSLLGLVPKVYLDTDASFTESRWFESGQEIPEMIDTGMHYAAEEHWFDQDLDDDGEDPDEDETDEEDGPEVIGIVDLDDDEEDPDDDVLDDYSDLDVVDANLDGGYLWDDDDDDDDDDDYDDEDDDEESGNVTIEAPFGANLIFECTEEEGFSVAVEIGEERRMTWSPGKAHALAGASIIVNPAAAPMLSGSMKKLETEIRTLSGEILGAYVRCGAGCGESTTDYIYGGERLIAENGELPASGKALTEGLTITDIDVAAIGELRARTSWFLPLSEEETDEDYVYVGFGMEEDDFIPMHRRIPRNPWLPGTSVRNACREIMDMQAMALARRMRHTSSARMVIGISGGLDSCLALLAAVRAAEILGMTRDQVLCVGMPAFGTSGRTKANAKALAECSGASWMEIDITESLKQHFEDIGHPLDLHDAAFENAQARERTQILMDLANMHKGIVVGTGDLSESALGWCTYNGDHISMYNVNADLPKTVIRQLVQTVADSTDRPKLAAVLRDILDTPVSPELIPGDKKGEIGQKTEEIVGPYELHDFFLYYMLRYGFGPERIVDLAEEAFRGKYTCREILHWLKLMYTRFFQSQFKRSCSPDGPAVFAAGLSPRGGWKMPSDASGDAWIRDVAILQQIEELTEVGRTQ